MEEAEYSADGEESDQLNAAEQGKRKTSKHVTNLQRFPHR